MTQDLRNHLVHLGNNGTLYSSATHITTPADLQRIVHDAIPQATAGWAKRRVLLYAHGGVVDAPGAIAYAESRIADYLAHGIYPIFFIWRSDPWSVALDWLRDKMPRGEYEREVLDGLLERLARRFAVRTLWQEMKQNASAATTNPQGGARMLADALAQAAQAAPAPELHLTGHSAGGIFHAPLVQYLSTPGEIPAGPMQGQRGHGLPVESCNLWAPGITIPMFEQTYLPAIEAGRLRRFALYTLGDQAERDDAAAVYKKSILYLVSNALEDDAEAPILGMSKFVAQHKRMTALFQSPACEWVQPGDAGVCTAVTHGGFDNDLPTIQSSIRRMLED
jgi:hypothetical protein